ncbi:MAG: serine hydrolase domain-containing protein [Minwuia sp.]|uniref:serine hydrolase domain-containing protein n=1 Tax=Minwuia sp. TaxID=2493630 RepID=UPI003A893238
MKGQVSSGFEAVEKAFRENFESRGEIGASCCVTVDGEVVADLWGGVADQKTGRDWDEDTVSIVFSATKGATAICAHHLIEKGAFSLATPVSEIWPEFGRGAKASATVRMMLDHTVGVPVIREKLKSGGIYDWDYMCQRLADEEPFWQPGERGGYHGLTFGWTVGELVRRASGKSLGAYFRDEIAGPLGIDFWIGLPEEIEPRVAPMIFRRHQPGDPQPLFLEVGMNQPGSIPHLFLFNSGGFLAHGCNTREGHAAELGGAGGITNGRGLALMYRPFANGGAWNGVELVGADTLATMSEVSAASNRDATLQIPVRFGPGFMKSMDHRALNVEGAIMGAEAFGHVGAGGSLGFADPANRISFGYTMNRMGDGLLLNDRGQALVDAVYKSLGGMEIRGGGWRPAA